MILALIVLPQMVRTLREYERGVILRLGKLLRAKEATRRGLPLQQRGLKTG